MTLHPPRVFLPASGRSKSSTRQKAEGRKQKAASGVFFAACLLPSAFCFLPATAPLVKVATPEAPLTALRSGTLEVPVRFTVEPGYHINSNRPSLDYLIPTRLEWSASGLKHLEDRFPPAELKAFSFSPEKKLAVYEGGQTLKSRFAVPATTPAGRLTLSGKLRYQACDDKTCYPPTSVDVRVPVEIRVSRQGARTAKKSPS